MKKNKEKGAFLRTCAGCGKRTNKKDLIRISKFNDEVFIDLKNNSDGRGTYLCKNDECIKKAQKTGRMARVLKAKIPEGIYENLVEIIGNVTND